MKTKNNEESIKVLPGIDTLYYFIPLSDMNYIQFYENFIEKEYIDDNFKFLGYSGKSKGFVGSWFEYSVLDEKYNIFIPLFKVGFKSPYKQKNVPNIYVQLLATGIYLYGLENLILKVSEALGVYLDVLNEFGDDFSLYKLSRVDVNMFVNYDFSQANWQCFRSPARSYTQNFSDGYEYVNGTKLETIYLGKRSSPICLRLYDKKKELMDNQKKNPLKYIIMADYFKRNGFTSDDTIWNIEFMIKSEGLRSYGLYNINDLFSKIGSVFKDLMTKYVFLGFDSHRYEKLRKSKHISRVPPNPVWEYLREAYNLYDSDVVERKVKKYDVDYQKYYLEKVLNDLVKANIIGVDVESIISHINLLFNNKREVV